MEDKPVYPLSRRALLAGFAASCLPKESLASAQSIHDYAGAQDAMGEKLEEVHIGRDGWLFLNGGSNQPIRFYTEASYFTQDHEEKWLRLLLSRKAAIEKTGARYVHMFAPDKLSVYPEYYGAELPLFHRRPGHVILNRVVAAGYPDLVYDTEEAIVASKPHVQSYWKTDTHWRADGTYVAYAGLCRHLGLEPSFKLENKPWRERRAYFDLGGKLEPQIEEAGPSYRVTEHARQIAANALVQEAEAKGGPFPAGLLGGSYIAFRNEHPSAHAKRVLLFGDSYSEVRPGAGLTRMLAETFRELHFFWSTSVDMRQVEKIRPDIVISQVAERFVRAVPDDGRDLEAYAAERLQNHRAKIAATP